MVGALGDIHGDFASARRIMDRHADVPFWVCVGDVADAEGQYEPFPAPLHFIKGNNEGFDAIADGRLPANVFHLPNATVRTIDGVRVAGLGGTFAPSWYETPAANLPHPRKGTAKATELADPSTSSRSSRAKSRDDKRRHFVREEVEACKTMERIDLFMTHEAPRPYRVGRMDAGKTPVNEILAALGPRLHLFGHHHRFSEQTAQGVRSVGLDLVSRSYLLIDAKTLEYQVLSS